LKTFEKAKRKELPIVLQLVQFLRIEFVVAVEIGQIGRLFRTNGEQEDPADSDRFEFQFELDVRNGHYLIDRNEHIVASDFLSAYF
jgi:hypothetical protein